MPNAKLILNPSVIPDGFTLVNDKLLKHPVDGQYGALLKHNATLSYVFHAAGANRNVPVNWANRHDTTLNK